jgi:hypothetical protein
MTEAASSKVNSMGVWLLEGEGVARSHAGDSQKAALHGVVDGGDDAIGREQ